VDRLQQADSHESDSIGAIVGSGDSAVAKMAAQEMQQQRATSARVEPSRP